MTTPKEMAILVGEAALAAYRNTLVGAAAPVVNAYFERASKPVVGDLVVETSSFGIRRRDDKEPEQCVGFLTKRETESWETHDEEVGTQRGTEEAWYITLLSDPERELRWTNATFIAVPHEHGQYHHWTSEVRPHE